MKYHEEITAMLIIIFGSVREAVTKAMLSPFGFWEKVRTFCTENVPDAPAQFELNVAEYVRTWMYKQGERYCYLKCDDWFIYAKDSTGKVYSLCTELWDEWLNLHEGADQEEDAIEKYMLPVAERNWNNMTWRVCPDLEAEAREVIYKKGMKSV